MEIVDIQVRTIMRLFQGSPFPRTVSTYATNGRQITVNSIDEIYEIFNESKFVDCRINAFPVGNINADFVMADLDLCKFRTERMLIKALHETIVNVGKDLPGAIPMALFTGGGYHVYQPIDMPVLEEESIFRFFDNPSTEFIRYAAQRWTNGKNDACNNPSIKSCLLRVPGSINSKNNKKVKIVQEWNGRRPKANVLLFDFYIKLSAKKLKSKASATCDYQQLSQYYAPTSHHFVHKTYRHYGRIPQYPADRTNAYEGIAWIESILGNGGMSDYRKVMVDLVIAPYLVNIKQYNFNDAYNKIINWLDRCSQKRRLDFNARFKARYALNRSKQNGIRPMRLDTMKDKYLSLYQEVVTI